MHSDLTSCPDHIFLSYCMGDMGCEYCIRDCKIVHAGAEMNMVLYFLVSVLCQNFEKRGRPYFLNQMVVQKINCINQNITNILYRLCWVKIMSVHR